MAMGLYRDFTELEESLSLPEMESIIMASREKEHRYFKFMAAMKGVNLDDPSGTSPQETQEDRFELIKARAEARVAGRDAEEAEYEFFGVDYEVE